MAFVLGTALMVAAILLLGCAKHAVTRLEDSSWVRNFAATETMALIITMITAFGGAFLCAGVVSSETGLGWVELGASLGVIALSIVGVVRIFRVAGARPATRAAEKPAVVPVRAG